jgi:hypothetical protein
MPNGESKAADDFVEMEFGLTRDGRSSRLDANIFYHWQTMGRQHLHHFYFPEPEIADRFHEKFGGERFTLPMEKSPRKNDAIFDNFTLDDLVYLYGDPLPNLIQYHLVDMEDRLSGYFDRYKFMHQSWAKRAHWLPSAFVYVGHENDRSDGPLKWLYEMLGGADGKDWQSSWESSAMGVYEFDDPQLAAAFKLTFGSPVPEMTGIQRNEVYDRLTGPVTGMTRVDDRFGRWYRQTNLPDYTIPRTV